MKWFRWWWLVLLVPIIAGLARLHLDAELLDLLPAKIPAVQGLKIYQQHFTDARELIVTVRAQDRDSAEHAASAISSRPSPGSRRGRNILNRPPNSSPIFG